MKRADVQYVKTPCLTFGFDRRQDAGSGGSRGLAQNIGRQDDAGAAVRRPKVGRERSAAGAPTFSASGGAAGSAGRGVDAGGSVAAVDICGGNKRAEEKR